MSELGAKRRVVAIGAASGGLGALTIALVLYRYVIPPLPGMEALAARLALALQCAAVAALPLLAGIGQVANTRFLSDAIDPTAGAESKRMIIHGRYVDNTLQQFVLFLVATLSLSTLLDANAVRIIPALAVVFVLGRVAFWVGYLRDPLLRAPGMAATMYPTAAVLAYVLYRIVRH